MNRLGAAADQHALQPLWAQQLPGQWRDVGKMTLSLFARILPTEATVSWSSFKRDGAAVLSKAAEGFGKCVSAFKLVCPNSAATLHVVQGKRILDWFRLALFLRRRAARFAAVGRCRHDIAVPDSPAIGRLAYKQ